MKNENKKSSLLHLPSRKNKYRNRLPMAGEGETLEFPYTVESKRLPSTLSRSRTIKREAGSPELQIMTLDAALPLMEEAQKSKYCGNWQEITEEDWHDALEVLPPEKWETVRGVNIFRMSEYLAGNITAHYLKPLRGIA
jgi:hypothetical protein